MVADDWRRKGVGSTLIERLDARASAARVECLKARMLVGDSAAPGLLAHIADQLGEQRDGDIAEVTARLRVPAT